MNSTVNCQESSRPYFLVFLIEEIFLETELEEDFESSASLDSSVSLPDKSGLLLESSPHATKSDVSKAEIKNWELKAWP